MKTHVRGLVLIGAVLGFASAGCTLPMVAWGTTNIGEGKALGVHRHPNGVREVLFKTGPETYREIRVPADWRQAPVREITLRNGETLLELENLLDVRETTLEKETMSGWEHLYSLELDAVTRMTLQTHPNTKDPTDHTPLSGAKSRSYLAVVRFLDNKDRVLHALFGYAPDRFRWVRLSEPVDLGHAGKRLESMFALLPFCLLLDSAALGADISLNILIACCGVTPPTYPCAIFTTLNNLAGKKTFNIDSTDLAKASRIPDGLSLNTRYQLTSSPVSPTKP